MDLDTLAQAVAFTESSNNPKAVGKAGELGLMQIKPATAHQYGVKDPKTLLDPDVNMMVGKRILSDLMKRYRGNIPMVLAAYNAGPHAADRGVFPMDYVRKVFGALNRNAGISSASAAERPVPSGYRRVDPASLSPEGRSKLAAMRPTPTAPKGFGRVDPSTLSPEGRRQLNLVQHPPWDVRASEWAPAAGQFLGGLGGGFAGGASPIPGGALVGRTLGAYGGTGIGEEIRLADRYERGLPIDRSQTDIWGARGIDPRQWGSALVSGVSEPVAEGVTQLAKLPFGAIGKAAEGSETYQAARGAFRSVGEKLRDLVGMGEKEAGYLSTSVPERQAAKNTYEAMRKRALDRVGALYDRVLDPFKHRPTNNGLVRRWQMLRSQFLGERGMTDFNRTMDGMIRRAPTVAKTQEIVSDIRSQLRRLDPREDAHLIGKLKRLEAAALDDIHGAIGSKPFSLYQRVDAQYSDTIQKFPGDLLTKVKEAPSATEIGKVFGTADPTAMNALLDEIDRLPPAKRFIAQENIRRAYAASVQRIADRAAPRGANELPKFRAAANYIERTPPEFFRRLFGSEKAKDEFLMLVDRTGQKYANVLRSPSEEEYINEEVMKYLKTEGPVARYVSHHWIWAAGASMAGGYAVGGESVAATFFGLFAISRILHTPTARKLYLEAVTSDKAATTARLLVAALNAWGVEELKRHALHRSDLPDEPAPRALPAPMPTPGGGAPAMGGPPPGGMP